MNHPGPPSWERLLWSLIATVIGLELLAGVLPRLLVPLVVLAVIAVIVRLVWWYIYSGRGDRKTKMLLTYFTWWCRMVCDVTSQIVVVKGGERWDGASHAISKSVRID